MSFDRAFTLKNFIVSSDRICRLKIFIVSSDGYQVVSYVFQINLLFDLINSNEILS